jgi:hypothetical protein
MRRQFGEEPAVERQREELVGLRGCGTEGRHRRDVRLGGERLKLSKQRIGANLLAGVASEAVDLLGDHCGDLNSDYRRRRCTIVNRMAGRSRCETR